MSEADETHLTKERHSEICAQQALARVHDLCDLTVGTVQGVIEVSQSLPQTSTTGFTKHISSDLKVSFNFCTDVCNLSKSLDKLKSPQCVLLLYLKISAFLINGNDEFVDVRDELITLCFP